MYFSIDLATGIVTMDSGSYQATVTPSLVMWVVPYQDFGGGSYRPAANYAFDRNSGVLSASGSDFSSTAYCQRGVRPAPVLP